MELYENIKKRRNALGLTQLELAQRVGYTDRSSIAKIEAGKVDLTSSKIIEFAEALLTTPGALMGNDGISLNEDNAIDDSFLLSDFCSTSVDAEKAIYKIPLDYRKYYGPLYRSFREAIAQTISEQEKNKDILDNSASVISVEYPVSPIPHTYHSYKETRVSDFDEFTLRKNLYISILSKFIDIAVLYSDDLTGVQYLYEKAQTLNVRYDRMEYFDKVKKLFSRINL